MPNTSNYSEQGGAKWVVGGELEITGDLSIESGGEIDIESGGALKIAGTDKTAILAAAVAAPLAGVATGYKVARGNESFTGTSVVTSGLATVVSAVATLSQDVSADCLFVSVSIPTQTGGNAGKFTVKGWANATTPTASTETGTAVSWIAIGT